MLLAGLCASGDMKASMSTYTAAIAGAMTQLIQGKLVESNNTLCISVVLQYCL